MNTPVVLDGEAVEHGEKCTSTPVLVLRASSSIRDYLLGRRPCHQIMIGSLQR
jgi:hypothetical protein